MLDASDVLVVLDQLDRAGLVVWLDGGWGVDALLGRQSRPHQDLDLAIARHDCAVAQAALAGAGFHHDLTAVSGLPARLVLVDAGGRRVDLHPVVFDGHGNGWQELGGGTWGCSPSGSAWLCHRPSRPRRATTGQIVRRIHPETAGECRAGLRRRKRAEGCAAQQRSLAVHACQCEAAKGARSLSASCSF